MESYEDILLKNNQKHILNFIEKANEKQKESLIEQIYKIDFEQLNNLYQVSKKTNLNSELKIEHAKFVSKEKLSTDEYNKLKSIADNIIKNGEYAVVTMAGGQGTRLGHDGPKGTFLLDVEPQPKYLFEIITEGLKRANKEYGITLNWYIMTSKENNEKTVSFFEKHNYFEYPKEYIRFFIQGDLPLLGEDGKILLDENMNIKLAAAGNGCIYQSMKQDGIIEDMKKKGIKWVFIGAVDNVLVNMVDPILLGVTISEGNEIGSKSVVKSNPHEPVGVFCKINGAPGIIEYSEISKEMAEETDENGELLYGDSNIMGHLYSIEAIEKISEAKLPYHSAHKKASYLQENGEMLVPEQPNAYKYEAFIFDGFRIFNDMSILRVKREDNFAPIKNKEGNDSPETASKLYNNYWKNHK